tara:strand:+ start:62 stop:583 length:522 start_codon:yes stop_codon:yes gene_type:complete
MKNYKLKTIPILIIFGLFFFVGFSQELSISEYEISNPKFKDIVDSIVDYNKIQLEKNELFEYDFFYIEIRKDIDKSILTISRVNKNVIDIDWVEGKNIGYMKYRGLNFMISGFDNRLMKQNNFQKKYQINENLDSDLITISFNSEFDYWKYQIKGNQIIVIYEPDNFRKVKID